MPNGPIDNAGGKVAEYRIEAEPLEQRHRDDARAKKRDDRDEIDPMGCFAGHDALLKSEKTER